MTKDIKVNAPKRRKVASLERSKARAGWIFVLPFIIGFVLIYLPIIVDSVYYTLCEFVPDRVLKDTIPHFVGWENYRYVLFDDPSFVKTLLSGFQQLAFDIPMILIFSLFMAVLLNQNMAGRAAFRAIFFIPVILSCGIMESIEAQNVLGQNMESAEGFSDGSGTSGAAEIVSAADFSKLFSNMMVGNELFEYVAQAINNIYDIVNRSGVQMLIFLAGLQSISPAIYESVQIDGATAWETFWKITFPMISPMLLVNAVYTIIDSFTTDSNVVMTFISKAYSASNGTVRSSAMAWIYFLLVIIVLAVVAGICSSFIFYQRKD